MSSEQRVRLEGTRTTESGLVVCFTIGDRTAKRVREIRVPYAALLDACVVPGIDREATRRLNVLWTKAQDELPWDKPGVDLE